MEEAPPTEEVDDVELTKQLDAAQNQMLGRSAMPQPQAPPEMAHQVVQAMRSAMAPPAHPYMPVLKAIRGCPVTLEVGEQTRPAVELVKGIVWDLFQNDELLLVIVNSDVHDRKPDDVLAAEAEIYKNANAAAQAAGAAGRPVTPPTPSYLIRTWQFKWILTRNVIAVQQETMIAVNHDLRKIINAKHEPLYNDGKPQWHLINNYIANQINEKLKALGFAGTFTGPMRTPENTPIEFEKAEFLGKK